MSGPITFEYLAVTASIVVFILTVWWRIETRIRRGEEELEKKICELANKLGEFQIESQRVFVPASYFKGVEERLFNELRRLSDRIDKVLTHR